MGKIREIDDRLYEICCTLHRIEQLLAPEPQQPREPRKVKLTDAEWLLAMIKAYPSLDVTQCLSDCEAHYVSKGQVMTRAKGSAWLRRQMEWNKPVAVPGAVKKHGGLVL